MSPFALRDGVRAAVFGASGAIGAALVERLRRSPRTKTIYAGARRLVEGAGAKVHGFTFDLTDEGSIAAAAEMMGADGPLDLVVVASGILHDGEVLTPEKSWRAFSASAFERAFALNATGPALVAKHMLPLLTRDQCSVFAALSARVGSIEDNRLGGWASYRASKAALHQIIRTCAIELARTNPLGCCVALHPGTVDSPLSKPFQRAVAPEKLFTPAQSAEHLLDVIDGLSARDSGRVFAWDGGGIPF